MLPRTASLALLACLIASLSGCAPISFGGQELTLRHDAKADVFDLLIVYEAIQASPDVQIDVSRAFAARVSGGHRELMIFNWVMHFDLEQLQREVDEQVIPETDAPRAWVRELVRNLDTVTISSSGYFQGELGRPGLYHSLHIAGAEHWISLFERGLYVAIDDSVTKGSFESDFELLDARSRELWIALAKERKGWLSLRDGVLTVDLPATGASASRMLRGLMQNCAEDPDEAAEVYRGFASHLTELRIADEHLVLRWKLEGPTWTFRSRTQPYDERLAVSLRESKALPETLPSRGEVVESFSRR
jgi:hypothetical protein